MKRDAGLLFAPMASRGPNAEMVMDVNGDGQADIKQLTQPDKPSTVLLPRDATWVNPSETREFVAPPQPPHITCANRAGTIQIRHLHSLTCRQGRLAQYFAQ